MELGTNVLVLGGAGFIGSHLVKRLIEAGCIVTVIDNLDTGKVENLMEHPRLRFVLGDIRDEKLNFLYEHKDLVFHLAALTRPQKSIKQPKETNDVNIGGTVNVLNACRENSIKRLVYASSSSLYGEQPTYPSPETATPNPSCPYALQKYVGELYCKMFNDLFGLEYNALRFFNVYGPNQDPNGYYACVIPKFIMKMKKGEQVEIYGTGEQARDFTYIDDVIDGIMASATSEAVNKVFNLGLGQPVSINRLYALLTEKMNLKSNFIFGPAMVEPSQTFADNTLAKGLLSWRPKVHLEEGLDIMIPLYGNE